MTAQLVLSLFPGIGLLDKAFEIEGFTVVRGPDVIWGGDIRTFHPPSGKFDGVIGGPPCQSFSSLVHLVRANGHEPKFGNLIPEFERCVGESEANWFVMENVPQAPEPSIPGYGTRSFLLDNSSLAGDDGFGQEQRRVRRFTFGMRGREAPLLMRWIDLAVFLLPDADSTITQWTPNNSKEAKTRKRTVTKLGPDHLEGLRQSTNKARKVRQVAVTSTDGGVRPSEKTRHECINGSNGKTPSVRDKVRAKYVVTGSTGGPSTRMGRYKLADACRLQGLPEDFLDDCPFTADGKLKAVANGVPIPMGRVIARAVKEAVNEH